MADTGYHMELVRRTRVLQRKKEANERIAQAQGAAPLRYVRNPPTAALDDDQLFSTRDLHDTASLRDQLGAAGPESSRYSSPPVNPRRDSTITPRTPHGGRGRQSSSGGYESYRGGVLTPTPRSELSTDRSLLQSPPGSAGREEGEGWGGEGGSGTPSVPALPPQFRWSEASAAQVFPDLDDDRDLFDTFSFI